MIPKSGDFWQNVQFEVELVWALDQITLIFLLAPSAIYNFNEYVALGLGGQYTYLKQKNYYASHFYGGSIIGYSIPYL
jgi:hypothetical protein